MELRQIPISVDDSINEIGQVFDGKGNLRNTYINGDGYITVSIKDIRGFKRTYGLHRLLALTFIPNTVKERTEVNHKDGNKTNNSLSNLEWVSPYENNIHSELLNNDRKKPKLLIYKNDLPVVVAFNFVDAQEKLGINYLDIWELIKEKKVNENGLSIEYLTNRENKPKEFHASKKPFGESKAIKTLNHENGEVLYFKSLAEAARYHGTVPSAIHQALGENKLLKKQFQVTYGNKDFNVFSKEVLEEAQNRGAKEVYGINLLTNEELLTESAAEFVRKTRLSKKAVTVTLASNRIRNIQGWVFVYKNKDLREKLKAFVESPVDAKA